MRIKVGFLSVFFFSLGKNSVCFLLLCNHKIKTFTGISIWMFYRSFLSFQADFFKLHLSVTNNFILLKTWDIGSFSPLHFWDFFLHFLKCFGIFYFMLGRTTPNCFSNCCVPSLVCSWYSWLCESWCKIPGSGQSLESLWRVLGALVYGSSTIAEESAKYFIFLSSQWTMMA